jgi:hypothetical protein
MDNESGPHRFLAVDQLSSRAGIPASRQALSGRLAGARPQLLGSVSGDGLRPADLSGACDIEACLRSLQGNLYHLGFRGRVALDPGGRERNARLAHLRGLCLQVDCDRAPTVCTRAPGRRSEREPVCFGFDDHRSVSGAVSLGPPDCTPKMRQGSKGRWHEDLSLWRQNG